MYIQFTTSGQFYRAFPTVRCAFGSKKFIELNSGKAEPVRYAVGCDDNGGQRLGLVIGYRDGAWHAPFSAPFAEIAYRKPQALEHVYDFLLELTRQLAPSPLCLTLPPAIYDPVMVPKVAGVAANLEPDKLRFEYNYHYPLSRFADFRTFLDPSFRNHFNHALREGFTLEHTADLDRAYAIIRANRRHRGYPLAMSLQQVRETLEILTADLFVLEHPDGDAASAIIYHSAPGIAQVIYWGDSPGFEKARPMNILPYLVLKYYADNCPDIRILDIGPASTYGIPNTGLCRYKEAFGCLTELKLVARFAEN